jgi:D-ribose pyranase
MKKTGLLNQQLSAVLAGMGHCDTLVIGDCGLPIPAGVERVDLALTPGVPGFLETLKIIQTELQIESAVIASEMPEKSPVLHQALMPMLEGIEVSQVKHERFKELTAKAVAVVRTGECTPYANIILKSGVFF